MKIWRPYTQEKLAPPAVPLAAAEGAHLILPDGRRLFDGISSWWLITHGHGCPEIRSAIAEQSQRLEQVVFANFTHAPAEKLAERLADVLPPKLSRLFFSDNGSTAVEVAMKMAYQMSRQKGRKGRRFLAFEKSYHGDTCGAMSVSGDGVYNQHYKGMMFEVVRVQQGHHFSDPLERWTADFESKLQKFGDEICAVILEPLAQGAGGMIFWPIEAVRAICALCRQHDIPVIFDEVMTGFGRTGSLFAFQQIGFVPDFLCLSKGLTGGFLPMGLTVTTEDVYEAFLSDSPAKMLFHGHSFTGNALSCAAAAANLELWKREEATSRLQSVVEAQRRALNSLPTSLPVRESRQCGTIAAIELNLGDGYGGAFSRQLHRLCLEKGLFLRALGTTVYLMPPYCATDREIQEAWNIAFEAIPSAIDFVNGIC